MFTPDDVTALALKTREEPKRCRDDLGRTLDVRLSEIACSFLLNHNWQIKPPPSHIVRRLRSINSAAKALQKTLTKDIDQGDREVRYRLTAQAAVKVSTPELTNLAGGTERLQSAIDAVREIEAWSSEAIARESRKIARRQPVPVIKSGRKPTVIKPARTPHHGNLAMQALLGDLAGVWLDYWKRRPSRTYSAISGDVGGPFIRFAHAFLSAVEEKLTFSGEYVDQDLRDALRASPQAIGERLKSLLQRRRRGVLLQQKS